MIIDFKKRRTHENLLFLLSIDQVLFYCIVV